jgi:hypothetical protein
MVRKGVYTIGLVFVLILFSLTLVSAMTVNVRTLPEHKVNIRLATTQSGTMIDSKIVMTEDDGLASMDYVGTQSDIKIQVTISKDGDRVLFHNFGNFKTTEDLYLQAIPDEISLDYKADDEAKAAAEEAARCKENWVCEEWDRCVKDENGEGVQERTCTDNNDCGTEEEKPELTQSCELGVMTALTGAVTGFKDKVLDVNEKINWSYILYGIIGIVVIGGVAFFFISRKSSGSQKLLVLSQKDKEGDSPDLSSLDEGKLAKIEKEVKQAQEEIEAIKHKKSQVSEAEKQFEEAKKRLEGLKGSLDDQ